MSVKRLFFVIPPYFDIVAPGSAPRRHVVPAFTIPYGILSLQAYVTSRCATAVEVGLLDLNVHLREMMAAADAPVDDAWPRLTRLVGDEVRKFAPDLVGVSVLFSSSFAYLEDVARASRQGAPGATVVAGGGMPSAAFKLVLDSCPSIDAVCKGEGELPLTDLIGSEDWAATLDTHPAWLTRKGLEAGKIPEHRFIWDLDQIPPLDYGIVELDDYNSRSIDKRYAGDKKREMAIHTSRGCPFLCVFCSNPSLHGREVRAMSIDRVVSEVRRMKDDYGLTVLLIEDDHFFFDRNRAKEVLRRLAELGVRIEFPNGVAVYAIDDETAALLHGAGVSTVALAVESGSDHVLNNIIRKPLKKKLIRPAVEALRKNGVQAHVFVVIGLPGEMPEHRQETLDMLVENGFDWAHIYCAVPIFGSRLYELCVENGYITSTSALDLVNNRSVITAPGVDPEEIAATAYDMNLTVNFVHNHNLAIGNYDTAIRYFQNVCDKYLDHAFAHYYLARAYALSGRDAALGAHHQHQFDSIVARDSWWRAHCEKHGLLTSGASVTAPLPALRGADALASEAESQAAC